MRYSARRRGSLVVAEEFRSPWAVVQAGSVPSRDRRRRICTLAASARRQHCSRLIRCAGALPRTFRSPSFGQIRRWCSRRRRARRRNRRQDCVASPELGPLPGAIGSAYERRHRHCQRAVRRYPCCTEVELWASPARVGPRTVVAPPGSRLLFSPPLSLSDRNAAACAVARAHRLYWDDRDGERAPDNWRESGPLSVRGHRDPVAALFRGEVCRKLLDRQPHVLLKSTAQPSSPHAAGYPDAP